MSRLIFASIFALFSFTGTPASAWLAENNLVVTPRSGGEFFVSFRGPPAARDFWCAAGDYVVRELLLPRSTRIYRLSPPPRQSGRGVLFSLSPQGAQHTGLLRIGRSQGLSASHARQICSRNVFRD